MTIFEIMNNDLVFLNIPGTTKEEVIRNLIDKVGEYSAEIKDLQAFKKEVLEREALGSTGIGDEVAIPHARTDLVNRIVIAFGRTQKPIDFEAIDGEPVRYIFLIAVPQKELKIYLTALAKLSRLVREKSFREAMKKANSAADLLQAVKVTEEITEKG